jgi:hypothetical protein
MFRRALILLGAAASCVAWGNGIGEYRIKAVFLVQFAKYVEWPAATFAGDDDPLVIGILGHDPFGQALDSVAARNRRWPADPR